MFKILVGAIIALVGVFLALALIIVVNKTWRDGHSRRQRRLRARIEPLLLRYATNKATVDEVTCGAIRSSDRRMAEAILLELADAATREQRGRMTLALERLGFIDERIVQLGSRSWWTRATAAEALGRSGSRRATAPLVEALDDESPEVRLRSATALAELGGATAVRPLIRFLDEPGRWSTIRVAGILENKGGEIVGDLVAVFRDLGTQGRTAILDILADLDARDAAPWIREKLDDPDTDVQARAAHALGVLHDSDSGPRLLESLSQPAWPVRAMVAKALGCVGHHDAIEGLCVALRDDEWWVRANAAEALCRLGNEGLEALERMLDDAYPYAAQQAVRVLEDAGIVDDQVGRLAAADQATRDSAKVFVEKVIATGQFDRLLELASTHPDGAVRWILDLVVPATLSADGGAA